MPGDATVVAEAHPVGGLAARAMAGDRQPDEARRLAHDLIGIDAERVKSLGTEIADVQIEECVQTLVDSELYRGRAGGRRIRKAPRPTIAVAFAAHRAHVGIAVGDGSVGVIAARPVVARLCRSVSAGDRADDDDRDGG